jgi:metal-sulfur cluster biosynthetic enzyme
MTREVMRLQLKNALYEVMDPETGVNLVDLGLIYEVDYDPETKTAKVVMTLTTPACPAGEVIMDGVQRRLAREDGVDKVEVELTFEPAWTPERITEDGRAVLGA